MVDLITENLDLWSSTYLAKKRAGRGSGTQPEAYGIKKLRELILQLAVMGKLVPQNPIDEPANTLLKKITEEKEQFIKEGKFKKQKLPPKIGEEEIPFNLPETWLWERLGNLALQVTDGVHHTPKYLDTGIPFISVKDIDGKTVSFSDCKYISQEQHEDINTRCNPEQGDLLICRIGTLGRATIVDTNQPFSLFVSVGLLKFLQEYYTPKFCHIVLHSPLLLEQYEEIKAGGSHTNKLNLNDIPRLMMPVAPLQEQHRIVTKVDELMALCDRLEVQQTDSIEAHQILVETLLNTLTSTKDVQEFQENWNRITEHFDTLFTTEQSIETLKQTILQLAVMGKLVPQDPNDEPASVLLKKIQEEKNLLIRVGRVKKQKLLAPINVEENPFILPKIWEWCYLEDIAVFENGDRSNRYPNSNDLVESGVPFFGAPDIIEEKLAFTPELRFITEEKFSELSNGKLIDRDFVMLLRGSVGKTAQFHANDLYKTGFINAQMLIIRLIDLSLDTYIRYFFKSGYFATSIFEEKSGAVIQQIPASKIAKIKLPLPPLNEQHRIVAKVDELMTLCDALKQRIEDARTTQIHLADAIVEMAVK